MATVLKDDRAKFHFSICQSTKDSSLAPRFEKFFKKTVAPPPVSNWKSLPVFRGLYERNIEFGLQRRHLKL